MVAFAHPQKSEVARIVAGVQSLIKKHGLFALTIHATELNGGFVATAIVNGGDGQFADVSPSTMFCVHKDADEAFADLLVGLEFGIKKAKEKLGVTE